MRPGTFLWWPKWPAASPSISASKGFFDSKGCLPPGSPSMPQGGPCLGNPGAKSLRTNGAPSYAANTPTHSVCCGTLCGPCLPSDGLSGSSCGSALSLCLRMPSFRASYSGIPSMPVSFRSGSSGSSGLHLPTLGAFHGGSSGGIPSLCHASLFAQGSNASGCVVVAFTAPPASSMLVVPLVGPVCHSHPMMLPLARACQ